jgi:hypothetical protein
MKGRAVAIGLALLLLLATLFLAAVDVADQHPRGSALSIGDRGRRASYLVLEELGFETEVWTRPPGLLPAGGHVLWMPLPPEALSDEHYGDPLFEAREAGAQGRGRYDDFMHAGGTIVLPASTDALHFIEEELGFEQGLFSAWELDAIPEVPGDELLASGDGEFYELAAGEEVYAQWMAVGDGYLAFVAEGRWLDNARLGEGDSALVLTRLVGYLAGPPGSGTRVLFDEHVFGGGGQGGPLGLAFAPDTRLLTLHLILLALLVVWVHAWGREFPRDPAPLEQLAPLARARSQAGLLVRSGHVGLLADFLRAGTLRRLGARLRGSEPPPSEELTAMVHRVALESGHADRADDWTAVLLERTVTDLTGLVLLDRELRRVEEQAGVHAD